MPNTIRSQTLITTGLLIPMLLVSLELTAGAANFAPAETRNGMKLVFSEDFESGNADRWEPTDAKAWRIVKQGDNTLYNQFVKRSQFEPPVRSPYNRALLKDVTVGSFVLDVDLQSTHPDYGHRDMCLFFGYQDDSRLYYVHLGKKMDPHANNIFIVNKKPRTSISTKTTPGTNWDDEWHHVRIVRNAISGDIAVYFDDMKTPAMTANDTTFTWGRIGIGSFDDTGNFDNIRLYGVTVEPMAGTQPLDIKGPLGEAMVAGINRYALRELDASVDRRASNWNRDTSSVEAYAESIAANRERFRTIIGAVDPRVAEPGIELVATTEQDSLLATTEKYTVHAVRWQVLDGVEAEGLLLDPKQPPKARVVVLPDADWTPETFAGLTEGVDPRSQIPKRLVETGLQVLIPTLINRADTHSGNKRFRFTNQPHREFIYRMAFQMGRHLIGYEVQKVLAAVDRLERMNESTGTDLPIGVAGVGEGGLLALHSAAADPRIDAALVSGYFQQRERVWEEPIYRNVWSLLTEFGDAEIASLIAPRPLVIEACAVPEIAGPPAIRRGRLGAAPGKIEIATLASARVEHDRVLEHYRALGQADALAFVASREGDGPAGSEPALAAFLKGLSVEDPLQPPADRSPEVHGSIDVSGRHKRQFDQLVEFTQQLLRHSASVRDQFWSSADRTSVESWVTTSEQFRETIWEEMFGKLPPPEIAPNVRTRKVIDRPEYTGYEVVIDVYPDVIASGVLLLPTDMKPAEKRPVVVCQHGLEGTPASTITASGQAYNYYKSFAVQLAKRGFITYSPQNPYRGRDEFRTIQRKSNPLKRSLFSYIIRQHERTLEWLSSLPNVDPERIAFYGLSYGGKTAVRVPPILKQYALSICSADFNEWIRKNVTTEARYSYMFTGEYEMVEWNMGHVANYAELASLMAPRPFMVERGHDDGVAPDEWVAWEFAKVRRHYVKLGLGDRAEIEFFNGPHSINAQATFDFLHKHLRWPRPAEPRAVFIREN